MVWYSVSLTIEYLMYDNFLVLDNVDIIPAYPSSSSKLNVLLF